MAKPSFKRRQRAKKQRIDGVDGFVPVKVALEEAERLKKEAEEKILLEEKKKKDQERRRKQQEQRQREEDEAKIKQMYEESLLDDNLEYMRIPLSFILSRKKEINEILKYKKGAEQQLKGRARYLGTSKSSLQRKKLPTAEQNGSQLTRFGFTIEKRKRDEAAEDPNSTVASNTETMEEILATEFSIEDMTELDSNENIMEYEQEEDQEPISNIEDIEEMENLIPILEQKYSSLIVSDNDQQQTSRAKFDLRKYNTFRYASLIAYFKKRCFDNKKKVASIAKCRLMEAAINMFYVFLILLD